VVAYLKKSGYVGIGRVINKAVKINDFIFEDKSLRHHQIKTNTFNNAENENSEYAVKIDWIKTVDSNLAKWKNRSGLFTSQLIKASLKEQRATKDFLEEQFDIKFNGLQLVDI